MYTHTHTHTHTQTHTHIYIYICIYIANTNNHCNVLIQYIHDIPYVHTITDYNDVNAIYH